jgi:LemA protein
MKKGSVLLIVLLLLIVFGGFYGCNKRNKFMEMNQKVKKAWGTVETQYQRRMDLVDQLVSTVKGQANFERGTLEAIVNARASATQVRVDAATLDPAQIEKYKAAQGELSMALGRLLSITENYPELRTNQGFSELRVELAGTENRIAKAREDFNSAVTEFNIAILRMPGSIFAWGYKELPTFEAEKGSEKAPKINFDFDSGKK